MTQADGAFAVAPWPVADFAAFGDVERRPLSKIQKLTGDALSRNWVRIPHVTHQDDADVTALEQHRSAVNADGTGPKITPLAYIVKAVASALMEFPHFNASLDADQTTLILKRYFHIGVAIDTPRGLVVAVLRDCDTKGLADIASWLARVSVRARTKGLPMAEMVGGCMSVSSLGALGGTGFTPIINAPEVAILGVSQTQERPVRAGAGLAWRRITPLSLSYDHRVINGADAARFVNHIKATLLSPEALMPG